MIHIGGHSLRYANVFITMLDTTISVFVFGQYYAKSNLLWKSFRNFSKQFATAFIQSDVFSIGHHICLYFACYSMAQYCIEIYIKQLENSVDFWTNTTTI